MIMKLRISYIALCFALTHGAVFAADGKTYQHEAKLNYKSNSDNSDHSYWIGEYRYYLEAVEKSNRPYNLTGFLSKTSNVGIHSTQASKKKSDNFFIDGQYFLDSQWYVSAKYNHTKSNNYDYDEDDYGASVGYFFTETAAIYFDYQHNHSDLNSEITMQTDGNGFSVGVKSYTTFEATSGLYLQASIGRNSVNTVVKSANITSISSDDITSYRLNADWYLTDTLSVGGVYAKQDGDTFNEEVFEVNASFIQPLTDSISAEFEVTKLLKPDVDGVYYKIGLSGRF